MKKKSNELETQGYYFYALCNHGDFFEDIEQTINGAVHIINTTRLYKAHQFNSYKEAFDYSVFHEIIGYEVVLVGMSCVCLGRVRK